MGRLRFDEYNYESKASVYEQKKRYAAKVKLITDICDLDFMCIDSELPSIHLRLPLNQDIKLQSNPKMMEVSKSYIKMPDSTMKDDENGKENLYFKNVLYLPDERIFHGVID